MTETRRAFISIATSMSELPSFVRGVGQDGSLLNIEIATPQPAFNFRGEIDLWFLRSIAIPALKAGSAQVMPLFRGVDPLSLQTALRQGIDVTPTDHHWYGDSLEKALEYGGDYPSLLIIDGSRTERTFCEVRIDAPASEHEAGRQLSGHKPVKSRDGSRLLYSRLPPSDKRRGSEYEFAYAHYIPGDAREALIGYITCAEV